MKKRSLFIVIEGTDKSGKQTQSEELVKRLVSESKVSERITFPQYGTPTGDIVGDCYLGKGNRVDPGSWFVDPNPTELDPLVACLYYAADRLAAKPIIEEKLDSGLILISDRYVESNMGHQCGKLETFDERAKLRDKIEKLEYCFLELPRPDKVIFLYMPFEAAQELGAKMGERPDAHEGSEEHLRNAERAYLELVGYYGWTRIDCTDNNMNARPINEIHEEVYTSLGDFRIS